MAYIIVTDRETVVGAPFQSFNAALAEATRLFGEDMSEWLKRNVRVEENRPYYLN